jgi:hypothetical protein
LALIVAALTRIEAELAELKQRIADRAPPVDAA